MTVKLDKNDKQNIKRLVSLRECLGLTVRDMAKEFKISHSTLSQWENGKTRISGTALRLLEMYEEKHKNKLSSK